MNVPILDLARQYEKINPVIDAAVAKARASGRSILGSDVNVFKHEVTECFGVKGAIGAASGTDTLFPSLKALRVSPGDKVIIPRFILSSQNILRKEGSLVENLRAFADRQGPR